MDGLSIFCTRCYKIGTECDCDFICKICWSERTDCECTFCLKCGVYYSGLPENHHCEIIEQKKLTKDEVDYIKELTEPTKSDYGKLNKILPLTKSELDKYCFIEKGEVFVTCPDCRKEFHFKDFENHVCFADRILDISNRIGKLVIEKNKSYDDAFNKTMDKYGEVAFLIRMEDKIKRLEMRLSCLDDNVDESLIDCLNDIIGYCLLMLERIERTNRI